MKISMRKSRRYVCTILLILIPRIVLFPQVLPAVAVYSLSSTDNTNTISHTVNDLVFSFIRELRTYRIVDMRSESPSDNLGIPEGVDFIFYGNLQDQPEGIKLELVLKGGPEMVTRKISRVYENSNRILLESRMLVRELFDQSVILPDPVNSAVSSAPVPSSTDQIKSALPKTDYIPVKNIDALAGSWHGEQGIEKILILRGGRGVVILSSGVSFSLEIRISGDDLIIIQKGPISPLQFIDLSDQVAKQAVAIAPPLEWHFMASPDYKKLSGTKKSVSFKNDGKNIISMDPVETTVFWSRD